MDDDYGYYLGTEGWCMDWAVTFMNRNARKVNVNKNVSGREISVEALKLGL